MNEKDSEFIKNGLITVKIVQSPLHAIVVLSLVFSGFLVIVFAIVEVVQQGSFLVIIVATISGLLFLAGAFFGAVQLAKRQVELRNSVIGFDKSLDRFRMILPGVFSFLLLSGFLLIGVAIREIGLQRLSITAVLGLAGILLLTLALVATWQAESREEDRRKDDVKKVLDQGSASTEYFEKLVNINVENLSIYYVTVKGHANKSFLASLFVGVVGFLLIGIGIALAIRDPQHGPSVAILSGLSGVATEFISAVFFYLYSRTVRQMKEYHDSLLAVQNILLSFKLVGDTSDPKEKARMIEAMLEYLVGKASTPSERGPSRPTSPVHPPANKPQEQLFRSEPRGARKHIENLTREAESICRFETDSVRSQASFVVTVRIVSCETQRDNRIEMLEDSLTGRATGAAERRFEAGLRAKPQGRRAGTGGTALAGSCSKGGMSCGQISTNALPQAAKTVGAGRSLLQTG